MREVHLQDRDDDSPACSVIVCVDCCTRFCPVPCETKMVEAHLGRRWLLDQIEEAEL